MGVVEGSLGASSAENPLTHGSIRAHLRLTRSISAAIVDISCRPLIALMEPRQQCECMG